MHVLNGDWGWWVTVNGMQCTKLANSIQKPVQRQWHACQRQHAVLHHGYAHGRAVPNLVAG
jgi:hypothetical protein